MRAKLINYCIWVFILFIPLLQAQQKVKALKTLFPPASNLQAAQNNLLNTSMLSGIGNNLQSFLTKAGVHRSAAVVSTKYSNRNLSAPLLINNKIKAPARANTSAYQIDRVVWNYDNGMPRLIELKKPMPENGNKITGIQNKINTAKNFLAENKFLLKSDDPAGEFAIKETNEDEMGYTHIKFKQMYKGIEVWAKEIIVHMDGSGNIIFLNGIFEKTPSEITGIDETVSGEKSIEIALSDIRSRIGVENLPGMIKQILEYNGPAAKKIIWHDRNNKPYLAWAVEVRPKLSHDMFYFIDAFSGKILDSYNSICYDGPATGNSNDLNGKNRTFGTYQVGSQYYMIDASQPMFNSTQSKMPDEPVGAIVNLDLKNQDLKSNSTIYYVTSTNNQWNDAASVSSHFNATLTYNYFHNVHNRNSIDDKGMTIYSIVHVTDGGKPMENAFWSGKLMCYGDGKTYFKPLAGGLDVAAHEMTHGVTQYTANLEYKDQSGALNESFSDVFGALVDTLNWKIGEDIIKDFTAFPSGALRDMEDPHNGGKPNSNSWQPAKMSEFVHITEDEGGVHINSGIPNNAFFRVASGIGRQKAGQIWYRALTVYLTRLSQFIDARIATEKAATDLFGVSSAELQTVKSAWDAVEVFEGNSTPAPPPSQLTGAEWILAANTASTDPYSIYIAKTVINSSSDYFALTKTPVLNRPAVSDTSGLIIFVDKDNRLRALYADPQNPQETILDTNSIWWSVAIGPGLNALALTSKYVDTTIYYIDFINNTTKTIKIATKAYDANDTKTALYADALSFDPTGNYLLFDAYNEVKNATGGKITYWNINMMDVQTENMESVFPPLSAGVSVGNPSFAKTSPIHFTFDYWDTQKNQIDVMAADFNTGNVGTVASAGTVLGYPTYSADDRTIAYHTETTVGLFEKHDAIMQMPLKDNMIEGTGAKKQYIIDATFPYWFVIGSRVTNVEEERKFVPGSYSLSQNYPNPFNPITTIQYAIPTSPPTPLLSKERGVRGEVVTIKVYNLLGKNIETLVSEEKPAGNYTVRFDGSNYPSGIYFYRIQAGNFSAVRKMVLIK